MEGSRGSMPRNDDGDSEVSLGVAPSLRPRRNRSLIQKQLLWTKTFKTLTRAIDDLYLACEVEQEMSEVEEAILLLGKARQDFQLLRDHLMADTYPNSPAGSSAVARELGAASWEAGGVRDGPGSVGMLSQRTTSDMDECDWRSVSRANSPTGGAASHPWVGLGAGLGPFMDSGQGAGAPGDGVVSTFENHSFPAEEVRLARRSLEFRAAGSDVAGSESVQAPSDDGWAADFFSGHYPWQSTGTGTICPLSPQGSAVEPVANDQGVQSPSAGDAGDHDLSFTNAWKVGETSLHSPDSSLSNGPRARPSTAESRCSSKKHNNLHEKLMSPDREKKTPQETKRKVDEKQAGAHRRRLRLESERLAKLAKAEAGRQAAAQAEADRMQSLIQDISERHQRSAAQRLAHLHEVARKAGDEVKKVREVAFIQELKAQDRMQSIQEKLEDGEARRQGRLAAVIERQRDIGTNKKQAQERRQRLEQERRDKIESKEKKKAAAQAKLQEERRAGQQAREVRAEQQRVAAEVRAAAEAEDAQERSERLEERLREADNRRLLHLETRKERATLSKEERREAGYSPCSSPKGTRAGGGLVPPRQFALSTAPSIKTGHLVSPGIQSSDSAITAASTEAARRRGARRRTKKLMKKLQESICEFAEPQSVQAGLRTLQGSDRCAHWRCQTAKLERLADKGEEAALETLMENLSVGLDKIIATSSDPSSSASQATAIPEDSRTVGMDSLELHAARAAGALQWFVRSAGSAPQPSWGKALQIQMLRVWQRLVGVPESCHAVLADANLPGFIKRLACLLSSAAEGGPAETAPEASPKRTSAASSCHGRPESTGLSSEGLALVDLDNHMLEALLAILSTVLEHIPEDDEALLHRHRLTVALVISSGMVQGLHSLFCLFDSPSAGADSIPVHVIAGLRLMKAMALYPRPQPLAWPLDKAVVSEDNAQAFVLALKVSRLAGLTSLLTGILLRASSDGDIANCNKALLPANFVQTATHVLQVLNHAAMLDVCSMQELLSSPDLRLEGYHLLFFILSYCTQEWDSQRHVVQELLDECLLFIGLAVVGNSLNQDVLRWGKLPNIIQLLGSLPFPYFTDPTLRAVLVPTLLCACTGNTSNCKVMETELSTDFVLQYLEGEASDDGGCAKDDRIAMDKRFPRSLWPKAREQLLDIQLSHHGWGKADQPQQDAGDRVHEHMD